MGVTGRTSPGSLLPADTILVDLQLFAGVFDVKSDEAYGAEEAQASQEAPESVAGDPAQDGGEPQETEEGAAASDEQVDEELAVADEAAPGQDATAPEKSPSTPAAAQASTQAPASEEWVLPGKFRDVDSLRAGYIEAEKALGRLHRELSQLKRQGASQAQIDAKQAEIQTEEQRAEANRNRIRDFLRDPIGFEQRIKQELRQELEREERERQEVVASRMETVQEAIRSVATRHPDVEELQRPIVEAITNRPAFRRALASLQADPYATPMDFAALIEDAYAVVKSESASRAVQAAREQGRREAIDAAQQRRQATVTSQGARRDQTQETPEQQLKRMILNAGRRRSMWKE